MCQMDGNDRNDIASRTESETKIDANKTIEQQDKRTSADDEQMI